jgi:hypothetical protein
MLRRDQSEARKRVETAAEWQHSGIFSAYRKRLLNDRLPPPALKREAPFVASKKMQKIL